MPVSPQSSQLPEPAPGCGQAWAAPVVPAVAFLFTDLRGSSALYERIGDAAAYTVVRRHFDFLSGIVAGHDGVVVKTMGDAVMAVFDHSADAVKAALAMQARAGDIRGLALRLGVHAGDCVQVEQGGRPDYFGSAVNLASRLRGQSRDGDIVLSEAVARQPAVRLLLGPLATRAERLNFKGFSAPVRLVRVARQGPTRTRAGPVCGGVAAAAWGP
jgi:class 3 adenylate cyclase